jgi:hypothetical protein
MRFEPFNVHIAQSALDELQARLARTTWPDELPGVEWRYGVPVNNVKRLTDYWRNGYDWRRRLMGRTFTFYTSVPHSQRVLPKKNPPNLKCRVFTNTIGIFCWPIGTIADAVVRDHADPLDRT